ncbi:MAG: hypothetical protein K0S76_359 [Herbinix sp.]|jgi:spore germination cell wall hydrolase CwlJ-like protein|nr:hypothetical protein [Herbinix sp.]
MKTKRTVLSMIVVLSVFYLSVIFDIRSQNNSIEGTSLLKEDSLMTETSAITEEADITAEDANDTSIQRFSYENNSNTSYLSASVNEYLSENTDELNSNAPSQTIRTMNSDGSVTVMNEGETALNMEAEASRTAESAKEDTEFSALSDEIATADTTDEEVTPVALENDAEIESELVVLSVPKKEAIPSKYANIGISIAENYVNIRDEASTEGKVLGKLFRDSAAEILKTEGDWYYVESGSVKGYVKSDYMKTGIPDDEIIEKYGILSIIVKVDGLNVREKPDTESDKLDVIYMNETYPVLDLTEEWIKVDITDDKEIGFVRREYAELIVDFKDAVSREEEKELERLKEEERIKKETEVKYRDGVNYTEADLKLLACLVHAEAGGQSYEGKLAVANIVLNRVKSKNHPNSIKNVIYAPGQFSVATSGSLAKQLANYDDYSSNAQRLSIKAARAALEGANNVGTRLYFHSYKSAVNKGYDDKRNCVKIDDQLFW